MKNAPMGALSMSQMLLEIRNATKVYAQRKMDGVQREVIALENFNLSIPKAPASIVTIAGESGSGKTTLAQVILGFTRVSSGQIIFDGQDVSTANPQQIKDYRRQVQAVFQDPFGVYNPFYRVEHVFNTVIRNFKLSKNKTEARQMIEEALNVVGLYGEDVLRKYPHQLSGGQRQRIMMARAYMIKPKLIVADEPVSMVDASLRASILDVMIRLKEEMGISFLYITHDLSTAYQIGDQIFVLYQGTIAEKGQTTDVIDKPHHPYVQLLVDSVPVPDPDVKWEGEIVLPAEEEMRSSVHKGCRFYPRCPHRMDVCLEAQPPLYTVGEKEHQASCYLYDEQKAAASGVES
jgi:peptide/nickel transport system ATP-binding protein